MRSFIFSVLKACTLLLVMLCALEIIARQLPSSYRYKMEWMQQHAREVETIILGPSTTYHAICPGLFDHKAFNLANSAQTARYDWLVLCHDSVLLDRCNTLIYPMSSLILNYPMEKTIWGYRCTYYRNVYGCNDHSVFSKYAWEVSYFPVLKKKIEVTIRKRGVIDCDSLGFGLAEGYGPHLGKLTQERIDARIRDMLGTAQLVAPTNPYADSIMSFCQRRGIRVLLIDVPNFPAFTQAIKENVSYKKMYAIRDSLLDRYDNVVYRSYQQDARFDSLDFANANHLNIRGAEKFTRILKEDFQL